MEMKLKSTLLKGIFSGIIEKIIKKKLGYSIEIFLEDFEITHDENGDQKIHANVFGKMKEEELIKIKKDLGL